MKERKRSLFCKKAPQKTFTPESEARYHALFPYYAELTALTGIRKKPGHGVNLNSGIGGHLLLYLNGVRRNRKAGYPTLELCEPNGHSGVGISVNSHYRNAVWTAADGPDFLWHGALAPGEPVTQEGYERTQARAKALGTLDGVEFHPHLFRHKPPGMTDHDYMYEISIATDYAARFGRDLLRARVPLDEPRMAAIVTYLNAVNTPYREGKKIFHWRVLNNNCAHLTHNALAAAGIWPHWPTDQFFAFAAFGFPVPKNEFVDLVLRANDLPIGDADALYNDAQARHALLESGTLITSPGALAFAQTALQPNEIYDIDKLKLIFYDNPFWGPYRFRLARILREPRYSDLRANLLYFEQVYAEALARPRPSPCAEFNRLHASAIARAAAELTRRTHRFLGCPK